MFDGMNSCFSKNMVYVVFMLLVKMLLNFGLMFSK
jgi:hypothetical protein